MRKITLSIIACCINIGCFAQTNQVSGSVTDEQGKPVAFAFVKDAIKNNATFSDLDGSYSLNADPSSALIVSERGYKQIKVAITGRSDIKIILPAGGQKESGSIKKSSSDDVFKNYEKSNVDRSSRPIAFFAKGQEELHGSRYFFNSWVHGYAKNAVDSIFEDDNYLFNYDKITGILLYTDDGATMRATDPTEIKKFVLFDDNAMPIAFEIVPAIDPKHYLEVVASGSKYKVYKQLNTSYHKSDFQTNGITSSGQNYDSYDDAVTYYVVKQVGGQPQKIALKHKSIKLAFATDADKVNKFLTIHDSDEVDEAFLKSLGTYMNQ